MCDPEMSVIPMKKDCESQFLGSAEYRFQVDTETLVVTSIDFIL